jgi:rhodanese-related sulfurtransferase
MSTVTIALPGLRTSTHPRSSRNLLPVDLHRRLRAGRGIVVDVRDPHAFDHGHIPGSLSAAGDGARREIAALVPAGAAVAVIGSSPQDAARAASLLAESLPECDVAVVAGGIDGWRRQGFPVGYGLALNARRAVQQLQGGGVALIDARPRDQFAGGHVVGAISVPLSEWGASERWLPRLPLVVGASSDQLAAAAASVFRVAGHGCVWRIEGGGIGEMLDAGASLPVL